jgi:hypothetical protein
MSEDACLGRAWTLLPPIMAIRGQALLLYRLGTCSAREYGERRRRNSHVPLARVGALYETRVADAVGAFELVLVEDAAGAFGPVLLVPAYRQHYVVGDILEYSPYRGSKVASRVK